MRHSFQSGIADGADATQVRPSNWNAGHVWTWRAITGSGSLTNADSAIRASGTGTLTLPLLSTMLDGQPFFIKNIGTGVTTIAAAGSDGINNSGGTQWILPNQDNSIEIIADKTGGVWQSKGGAN